MFGVTLKRWIQRLCRLVGYEVLITRRENLLWFHTMEGGLSWFKEAAIEVNTVLDVGASNGSWSRICSSYFPSADYVLYEPNPAHKPGLESFKAAFPEQVRIRHAAVGGEEGETFFDASDPLGGALSRSDGQDMIRCPVTSLAADLKKYGTRGPFLLKLDTHGFEREILDGLGDLLTECSALIIEAYNYEIQPNCLKFWELCAYLQQKGFRCIYIADLLNRPLDKSFWQFDLFFVPDSWSGFSDRRYKGA